MNCATGKDSLGKLNLPRFMTIIQALINIETITETIS